MNESVQKNFIITISLIVLSLILCYLAEANTISHYASLLTHAELRAQPGNLVIYPQAQLIIALVISGLFVYNLYLYIHNFDPANAFLKALPALGFLLFLFNWRLLFIFDA